MSLLRRLLSGLDPLLIIPALLLAIGGVFVIASTGGQGSPSPWSQASFIVIGLGCFLLFAKSDYRALKRYTPALYLVMIGLLLLVQLFGVEILGAKRWIDLGVIQLQPSEIVKLLLIIILAKYLAERASEPPSLRELIQTGVYLALPTALVLTQPDLGTTIIFAAVWGSILLATKPKWRHLLVLLVLLGILAPLGWGLLAPYQRERLETFLDPSLDPLGSGYNVTQSTIAIGSGMFLGRGLGEGTQASGGFLPVHHSDFIFASLVEQLGFLGGLILLLLYAVMLLRGLRAFRLTPDRFGLYLAVGISTMLIFHLLINVGMNLGIMPVTGIPLPLVSYGGTSIIITFASLGVLQSIIGKARGETG